MENFTLTRRSDYSFPQPTMAPNAPSMFSFSQTEPSADLSNGPPWGTQPGGPQSYQDFVDSGSSHSGDAEEYLFTSGQTTPRGSRTDQPQTTDAMWTAARTVSSAPRMPHAMSRANSSRSSASCMSPSSHLPRVDDTGNAQTLQNGPQPAGSIAGMDTCLLLDPDAAAVPHIYWSDYNLDMNLSAENHAVFALAEAGPLHVVPAQMHLGTETGLPDNSSPSSWDCFSSSISRTSSPATIDDTWLSAPLSPHSSPDMKCQSPRYVDRENLESHLLTGFTPQSPERKLFMIPEDREGQAAIQSNVKGLSQSLPSRRQVSDGESARDHALYKNATIRDDGYFHCPWEGQQSCNHKPEKLKCNYE